MEHIYDIAVVGAGPAGAVFVKELATACPNLDILLIDGQSPESAKPCGGLLAPDAQKLLARFDLVLPKSVLEDPQIFAVETIDIHQKLVRYYQRHYLNMDRYAFDRWLLSLVPDHVTMVKGRGKTVVKEGDLYRVTVKNDDEESVFVARAVVGADGGGRLEHQLADGEAKRDDANFAYVACWEYKGTGELPVLHKEPLTFDTVHLAIRSYK